VKQSKLTNFTITINKANQKRAELGFPEISHATVPYLVAFSYYLFCHSLKILLRLLANNIKLFKQLLSILIRSTLGVFLTLLKNKIIEGNVLKVAKNGHFLKNRRQARNIVKSSHFGDKSPQMATLKTMLGTNESSGTPPNLSRRRWGRVLPISKTSVLSAAPCILDTLVNWSFIEIIHFLYS